ncbi:MAG: threonine synthase, partial [Candidatus Bipolaricaulia bacterium]
RAWHCECGGPFALVGTPPFSKEKIDEGEWSLWRYREMLPITESVSLGEGLTPLVDYAIYGLPVRFKLEFLMPTGSFKDRGAAVLVSFLKHLGVKEVVEDSSGNAAASLAAYCAHAGIKARIFVPAYASPAKLQQIQTYGAELVPVPGSRADAAHAAEEAAEAGSYYASHYWNPFVLEGLKTLAFELAEQLGWRAPDNLVFPSGQGTFLLGTYRGFKELLAAHVIEKMPRLFAVQAEACAPLAVAFQEGLKEPAEIEPGETVAEGVRIARPVHSREVLAAIRETEGLALAVTEEEIIEARSALAHRGLFVEPTSAVVIAGLRHLIEQGAIRTGELTVGPLTGSGLKSIDDGGLK